MVVVNRYDHEVHIEFNWELDAKVPRGIYKLKDLWSHQDIGIIDTSNNKFTMRFALENGIFMGRQK